MFGEIKIPEPMIMPAEIITLSMKLIERRIRSVSLDWLGGLSTSLLSCEDEHSPLLHSSCLGSARNRLVRRRGTFSSRILSQQKQF